MRREQVDSNLATASFEFFYAFSRFEYALKEAGHLRSVVPGAVVMPDWKRFADQWTSHYPISKEAADIVVAAPEQQVVGPHGELTWCAPNYAGMASDLHRVVLALKTVRNNLFHGGKHSAAGWDVPDRTQHLLTLGVVVLAQLAEFSQMGADFSRSY